MDIGTYKQNLKGISINQLTIDSVKEAEVLFLDANADQLLHGKREDGSLIGKYASRDYAASKYMENSLAGFGNIDLILTGAFKNGIFYKYLADGLLIDSNGKEKEGGFDLLQHYGDDVLGFTNESKEKIYPEFLEIMQNKLADQLSK